MTNLFEALIVLAARGNAAAGTAANNNQQHWRENRGAKPKAHLYL